MNIRIMVNKYMKPDADPLLIVSPAQHERLTVPEAKGPYAEAMDNKFQQMAEGMLFQLKLLPPELQLPVLQSLLDQLKGET